ncbi:hypothetical protein [Cryptosporangium japonicum]|uniref:Transcriptional regulator, AbiEi antitoxin, Type IV TA system n=1 Tax=Cryptosporangium japonicum TaxID=80872 RepID=A0ABP3EW70_9ACTN
MESWDALLRRQHGAATRDQLLAHGFTRGHWSAQVAASRWQRPIPGIYVVFNGPLPRMTRYWVAVLHAGPGAALSHRTAGLVWGLIPERREQAIHVTIVRPRNARSRRGLVVHRSRVPFVPAGSPPCTGVARTAVDLCATARTPADRAAVLGRTAQQYPQALREARDFARAHPRMPGRDEFFAVLADVEGGAHSALEWLFLVDVERAHGLPGGERQRAVNGTRQDVGLVEFRTTIELDGRAAHEPIPARWRDLARDNAAGRRREITLRYGWQDVRWRPCAVAAEVAETIRGGGWTGVPTPCGPNCEVAAAWPLPPDS